MLKPRERVGGNKKGNTLKTTEKERTKERKGKKSVTMWIALIFFFLICSILYPEPDEERVGVY